MPQRSIILNDILLYSLAPEVKVLAPSTLSLKTSVKLRKVAHKGHALTPDFRALLWVLLA